MVYTFDSNTIELYLKLCLWTMLHHDRGTIKIYILMDIKGSISTSTHLTERAVHDSPIMDKIPIVRVNSLCLHFHLNKSKKRIYFTKLLIIERWSNLLDFSLMKPSNWQEHLLPKSILILGLLCMRTLAQIQLSFHLQ